jgi:hypothetical protein
MSILGGGILRRKDSNFYGSVGYRYSVQSDTNSSVGVWARFIIEKGC